MRLSKFALPLAFSLALVGAAAAREPVNEIEGVTVTPDKPLTPRERVTTFSEKVPGGQFPVWVRPICPLTLGLGIDKTTYVSARIRQLAEQTGLKYGGEGCRVNVIVLFSNEPEVLLTKLRKKRINLYGSTHRSKVNHFIEQDRAVRLITLTSEAPARGASASAMMADVGGGAPEFSTPNRSRMKPMTFNTMDRMILVVDARFAEGLKIKTLGSYIAMSALTRPNQHMDQTGRDTIMSIFNSEGRTNAPIEDLTAWDEAYLKALYTVDPGQHLPAQIGGLVREIDKQLNPKSPAPKRQPA
ncbi:hypothetical protein ABOZ73_04265 [Caulobacter sp. 73W]|uniref:DUF2927 domain-containing protein n=1 Tax=Caulobacter sp. 73W TaxID=3161137 RepID=A0AB39KVM2_9CAUL